MCPCVLGMTLVLCLCVLGLHLHQVLPLCAPVQAVALCRLLLCVGGLRPPPVRVLRGMCLLQWLGTLCMVCLLRVTGLLLCLLGQHLYQVLPQCVLRLHLHQVLHLCVLRLHLHQVLPLWVLRLHLHQGLPLCVLRLHLHQVLPLCVLRLHLHQVLPLCVLRGIHLPQGLLSPVFRLCPLLARGGTPYAVYQRVLGVTLCVLCLCVLGARLCVVCPLLARAGTLCVVRLMLMPMLTLMLMLMLTLMLMQMLMQMLMLLCVRKPLGPRMGGCGWGAPPSFRGYSSWWGSHWLTC